MQTMNHLWSEGRSAREGERIKRHRARARHTHSIRFQERLYAKNRGGARVFG